MIQKLKNIISSAIGKFKNSNYKTKRIIILSILIFFVSLNVVIAFIPYMKSGQTNDVFRVELVSEDRELEIQEFSASYELPVPTRFGYNFEGWFTSEDYSKEPVTVVNGSAKVYAKWTPIEYTVTYMASSVEFTTQAYNYGDTIVLPESVPTKDADNAFTYDFASWEGYTAVMTISGNVTLTAIFTPTPIEYTVTYMVEGIEFTSQAYNYGDLIILPTAFPIKDANNTYSYDFANWQGYTAGMIVSGNVTLTAIFAPTQIEYTVTYMASGVEFTSQAYNFGDLIVLPETNPTKAADNAYTYEFASWEGYIVGMTVSGNVTFTAIFTESPIEYTVTYMASGAEFTSQAYNYGELISLPQASPTKAADNAYTYEFASWEGYTAGMTVSGNVTFTANFAPTPIGYTITFDSNDGSLVNAITEALNTPISAPNEPIKEGYTFEGWFTDDNTFANEYIFVTMPSESFTLYANWAVKQYTITFNSNSINPVFPITEDFGASISKPTDPTREGYTFEGWYRDDGTFANQFTFLTMPAESFTLYANWVVNQYTITFNSNGGSSKVAITKDFGASISKPSNPTRTGYTFEGWYIDNGTFANQFTFLTMPAESFTLYANWVVNQYTITFVSNEGSSVDPITEDFGAIITAPIIPTKEDYTFVGWYRDNGTFANQFTFLAMPASSFTLYAKWTVSVYTITFDSNGGTAIAPITEEKDTIIEEPIDPTREGYTFVGWFTDDNTFQNEYTFVTMPAQSFTVYAKWTINQYTITFDSNGGSLVEAITKHFNTSISKPTDPTREGCTFAGWYRDNGTFANQFTFTTMPAESFTLYAKWTVIPGTTGLLYYFSQDAYIVAGYNGSSASVVIPYMHNDGTYGTHPVKGISGYAFSLKNVTSITIPASVITIGRNAFDNCTYLTSVTFKDNSQLTSIGMYAFSECRNLNNITIPASVTSIGDGAFYNCQKLTSITIPESVTSIGTLAFFSCTGLTSVTILASATTIGYKAFQNCTSLISITIEGGITSIGNDAFLNCSSLTSIALPASVTSIGNYAFKDCTSLTSITFENNTLLTSIGISTFYNCSKLISISIPENVESIGNGAFNGCTKLTSITLPEGLTSIGERAFIYCSSLTSITIPDSVTSIGTEAFWSCINLASVTIPNNLTRIENRTFQGCNSFTNITIPNSVTSIGDYAFFSCDELISITIAESVESIGHLAFYDCNKLTTVYMNRISSLGVPTIGSDVFTSSSLTIYVLDVDSETDYKAAGGWPSARIKAVPYTITFISNGGSEVAPLIKGKGATIDAPSTIREGYTIVGWFTDDDTFANEFTFATMPGESFTLYANWTMNQHTYTFFDEDGITVLVIDTVDYGSTIIVPANPTKAATQQYTYSFSGWDKTIPATITEDITFIAGYSQTVNQYTYTFFDEDGIAVLAIDTIDYGAAIIEPAHPTKAATQQYTYTFNGWDKVVPATITEDITFTAGYSTTINKYTVTFYTNGDSEIDPVEVNYGDTVAIPEAPTKEAHEFNIWYSDEELTIEYSFAQTVTGDLSLYGSWFYIGTTGLSFTLINGDTEYEVSKGTTTATEVTIPSTYQNKPVTAFAEKAFQNYNTLTSIIIPNSITTIGGYAFESCSGLTSIEIPSSVTTIGLVAFQHCTGLTSIEIPSSVTSIAAGAFASCYGLTSIDIPSSVISIGQNIVFACISLVTLKTPAETPTSEFSLVYFFGSDVYHIPESLKTVEIREGTTAIAANSFKNQNKIENVTIPNTVTHIGIEAFYQCTMLKTVTIFSTVLQIGDRAFQSCHALTDIAFLEGLQTIGEHSFASCISLESIILPSTVTTIGNTAFYYCTSLQRIEIHATTPPSLGSMAFYFYDYDVNASFPMSNLKILVPNASVSTYKAASIWIEYESQIFGITSIVTFNSNGGTAIAPIETAYNTSITEPVPEKTGYSFEGWYIDEAFTATYVFGTPITVDFTLYAKWSPVSTGLRYDLINEGTEYEVSKGTANDTYIIIPSRYMGKPVTRLKTHGFSWDEYITGMYIPSSITEIDIYALIGTNNITSIEVSEDNQHFMSIDGVLFNKTATKLVLYPKADPRTNYIIPSGTTHLEELSFNNASNLVSVTIPNSVISIVDVFGECSALETVTFESGSALTEIGSFAFAECVSLTTINIPQSVTTIQNGAFMNCTSLKHIVIPSIVEYIYFGAFDGCTALESVTVESNFPPNFSGADPFENTNSTFVIYVPSSRVAIYEGAEGWDYYVGRIFAIA